MILVCIQTHTVTQRVPQKKEGHTALNQEWLSEKMLHASPYFAGQNNNNKIQYKYGPRCLFSFFGAKIGRDEQFLSIISRLPFQANGFIYI